MPDLKFIAVKTSIQNALIAAAAGNYRVAGNQKQEKAAENSKGLNRLVEVFYKNGSFPKDRGRYTGPVSHETFYSVELTVSEPSKVDLAVIDNPNSTAEQLQVAINGIAEATSLADISMDDLISSVYQTLMSGPNLDLDQAKGVIADRWIGRVEKSDPNPRGQLVVLTASMGYGCTLSEDLPSDAPIPSVGISFETELKDDNVTKQGFET